MITLSDMTRLARMLKEAEERSKETEMYFKEVKEHERYLREESIPLAMHELGIDEIKLDTGEKISIKQDVYASIPLATKNQAHRWLDANGYGGMIKLEVLTSYEKGESKVALELYRELEQRGLSVSLKESVHAQTLKAFLKDQMAKGDDMPLELFGARPVWTTKITRGRK